MSTTKLMQDAPLLFLAYQGFFYQGPHTCLRPFRLFSIFVLRLTFYFLARISLITLFFILLLNQGLWIAEAHQPLSRWNGQRRQLPHWPKHTGKSSSLKFISIDSVSNRDQVVNFIKYTGEGRGRRIDCPA